MQKFDAGAPVWLHNPRRVKGLCPKLQNNWEGPYIVINKLNDVIYRIQKGPKTKPKVVTVYTCDICHDFNFDQSIICKRHVSEQHSGYRCDECKVVASRPQAHKNCEGKVRMVSRLTMRKKNRNTESSKRRGMRGKKTTEGTRTRRTGCRQHLERCWGPSIRRIDLYMRKRNRETTEKKGAKECSRGEERETKKEYSRGEEREKREEERGEGKGEQEHRDANSGGGTISPLPAGITIPSTEIPATESPLMSTSLCLPLSTEPCLTYSPTQEPTSPSPLSQPAATYIPTPVKKLKLE
ncbi:unnamed protein product [Mytilus coruscus]|uniref:Integrase p58-like C-terminal domain-containing protein n=1 Tax=Mytilus coruscus TaxID=42192 RepID=A0A6J8AT61_MYTCO|nr:unnamed protein product [Mytilus coruscus]